MSRLLQTICILLLLLGGLFRSGRAQATLSAPTASLLDRYVQSELRLMIELGTLADSGEAANVENVRCLLGAIKTTPTYPFSSDSAQRDSFYVLDAQIEPVSFRRISRHHVEYDCTFASIMGVWHNHVLSEYARLGPGPWSWPDAPTPAAAACQLSQDDLRTLLEGHSMYLMVISVDARTFCWWWRDDARKRFASLQDLPIATRPDSGRLVTDWGVEP